MSDWTVVHKQHDGTTLGTFNPENLTFDLEKGENGPHTIEYEISRSALSVPDFIGPYVTDFELYSDSTLVLAGMHTLLEVNSDEEHAKIAGKGWLHYFERRRWPYNDSDPNYFRRQVGLAAAVLGNPPTGYAYAATSQDSYVYVRDMLDILQELTGTLNYTRSISAIGHTGPFSVDTWDTENILSKITSLSQQNPGEFDFWMDNAKVFHMQAPHRYDPGLYADDTLAEHIFDTEDPDSGVAAVTFTNTGPQATRQYGEGESPSIPNLVAVRAYAAGTTQFRLLEDTANFTEAHDSTSVNGLTRKQLLFGLNPIHEITITVTPEAISNFWTRFFPGIGIWVRANLEAHNIDSAQEIVSMECSVDTDGNEVVVFKLNQIYQDQTLSTP